MRTVADKAAQPRGTSASGLVSAAGWEMRYTGGSSDKYYRVVVADCVVIVNWGRYGAAGGLKVHRMRTPEAARGQALELTADKEAEGYWLSRDTTGFSVDSGLLERARGGGGTQAETREAREIIAAFAAISQDGAAR